MTTPAPAKLLTAEEFARLPDDPEGRQMELYDGEVIYMPSPGRPHGRTSKRIYDRLNAFAVQHSLGEVEFETGYLIRQNPDRVAAPDVCFLTSALHSRLGGRTYEAACPTLAVEVSTPETLDRNAASKALEYLHAGSERVWVVRTYDHTVTVYRPGGDAHVYGPDDTLTSDDAGFAVAGFELRVSDIFEPALPSLPKDN